jgi:hypothetical protein
MEIKYFLVTLNTSPFARENEQQIGCYINNNLATKVWHFLREVNDNKNIEIKINEYVGKYVIFDDGSIRLLSGGTILHDKLDRKEYLRLINIEVPRTDIESMRNYELKVRNK